MLFTDRGTPLSYRYQHYWACNTYSLISADNKRTWVKFHWYSDKGAKGLSQTEAKLLAGEDPDWLARDLRESIERRDFPRWKLSIQVMPEEDGYKWPWTFDATKVWPKDQFPLIEVGVLELNRNPVDHFSEVEQAAFSPSNVVPGISFSPDRLLQGRLLIYPDTQYHRLGPNYKVLPNNVPKGLEGPFDPYHALGGQGQMQPRDKFPHYWPSAFGSSQPDPRHIEPPMKCDGPAGFYDLEKEGTDEDYYGQSRVFYGKLKYDAKVQLIDNIATSLSHVVDKGVIDRTIGHLTKVDQSFGQSVAKLVNEKVSGRAAMSDPEKAWQQLHKLLAEDKPHASQIPASATGMGHTVSIQ